MDHLPWRDCCRWLGRVANRRAIDHVRGRPRRPLSLGSHIQPDCLACLPEYVKGRITGIMHGR